MGYHPSECVVIEDSEAGALAAINGGFDVYVYHSGNNTDRFESLGTNVFSEMKDLAVLLKLRFKN